MVQASITYGDKDVEVKEPTIEMWSRLALYKDVLDEGEFLIRLIMESTGLTKDEVMDADWYDIMQVGNSLTDYLLKQSDEFHPTFEFKGTKYTFLDLANLTFGEFIDIDTLLSRSDIERRSQLNLMMSMFYREIGEDGKIVPYDASKVNERAELFKALPIKYVHGSMSFFLRLEKQLREPSLRFLVRVRIKMWMIRIKRQRMRVLQSIGGGLAYLWYLPTRIYRRLRGQQNTH
jgi:hypothetical protein